MSTVVTGISGRLPPSPAGLNDFAPSADRARYLDLRMRHRLATSLQHILESGEGRLDVPQSELEAFLRRLEAESISPLVFSLYSDTVLAIEQDDLATASSYLREMLAYSAPASELRIKDITDPSKDPIAARYAQFINTDESLKIEVFPPSHEASATCRAVIGHAFELMERGDPDLAVEIRALLREIVLGAGSLDKSTMTFDGASAFMLWGAIIINSNQRTDELAMVQMLAHESSHNLLFGLSSDEPLVDNPPDETYSSPLRRDPRPMDGIYHATFVTARMYRAVWQLLKSEILSAVQRQIAEKELALNRRLFESGIDTVDRYAMLTPLGREVMAGAKAYMAAEC